MDTNYTGRKITDARLSGCQTARRNSQNTTKEYSSALFFSLEQIYRREVQIRELFNAEIKATNKRRKAPTIPSPATGSNYLL